jgi:hypothetical protein
VRQHVELMPVETVTQSRAPGVLQVSSQPAGVMVLVDGQPRGATPLTVAGIAPGEHRVSARFRSGTAEQRIQVHSGQTSTIHLASTLGLTATGWLVVDSPVTLQISEQGRTLGATGSGRLMLPAGEHVLDLASDDVGFRTQQTVRIAAGAGSSLRVDLPPASLSINASPWAEVWIDGARIGETPIGNITLPPGAHEIALRHPELGERRQMVQLRVDRPTRVGVDLRVQP